MLANGGDVLALYQDLVGHLLDEHAGVRLPAPPTPPEQPEPVDAALISGRYRSVMFEFAIDVDATGRAWLQTIPLTAEAALEPGTERMELARLRQDALITVEPIHGRHDVFALIGGNQHHGARFLHTSRAMPRQRNS